MAVNPFKPTAGKMPPILIGRESVIADFAEGLENGAGAPGRLMLVSGQRGFGKTVLLTELARLAAANGWMVVRETAAKGMCERIVGALTEAPVNVLGADIEPSIDIAGVASVRLGKVSIARPSSLSLRAAVARRFSRMEPGKGILFTVDETQAANRDELVALATAVQHIIGDQDMTDAPDDQKYGVAFVFAGLPSMVDDIVNDKVLTFLRRALREELGTIRIPDVRNAYQQSIEESGLSIGSDVALAAAEASGGHPYLVQLVGYYMWQAAHRRRSTVIAAEDVDRAVADAGIAFQDAVCAPTFDGLSLAQRNFLEGMAVDWPDSTSVTELAARLGKSRSWGSKYRERLLRAQVIRAEGGGRVSYAIPYFGDFMSRRR